MIKTQYAVLAEFQRGTDLIGTFDRIMTPRLPTQQRNLVFVVLLVTDSAQDVGPKHMVVRCLLPDQKPLFEQAIQVELKASDASTWLASARIALELQGMPLPVPGKYLFTLEMNGELIASHPFTVVLTPATKAP
jgi:uncharacterized protein DUF6941